MINKIINPINVSLTIVLITLVYRILICLDPNPEFVNGETNNVWNAIKSVQTGTIYNNPESTPYEIFQYTPFAQSHVLKLVYWERIIFPNSEFYPVSNFSYSNYSDLKNSEKIKHLVIKDSYDVEHLFNTPNNIPL